MHQEMPFIFDKKYQAKEGGQSLEILRILHNTSQQALRDTFDLSHVDSFQRA
jgi:hypothetical protein